jgi:hypothetical protein
LHVIGNEVNQQGKHIGLGFRRKNQISGDVIWSDFERLLQPNSRLNALDTLVFEIHTVKMQVGFEDAREIKTKSRPLSILAHSKRSIIEVKAETNCLAHALITAI